MPTTSVRNHTRHIANGRVNVRRHTRRVSWSERAVSATNGARDGLPTALGALVVALVSLLVWSLTAVMSVSAAVLCAVASLALACLGFQANAGRRRRSTGGKGGSVQRKPRRPQALTRRRRFRLWRHKMRRRVRAARHPLRAGWWSTKRRAAVRWTGRRNSEVRQTAREAQALIDSFDTVRTVRVRKRRGA